MIEMIMNKHCHCKANNLRLYGIVTYCDGEANGECLITTSNDRVKKYLLEQIDDNSPNIYNKFIDKCCKNLMDCDQFIFDLKVTINNINRCFYIDNDHKKFIEIINIDHNHLIYLKLYEMYNRRMKILFDNTLFMIDKIIVLAINNIYLCNYYNYDNYDDYHNDICNLSKCYIYKIVSTNDIRIYEHSKS
jgi:hypothetical protein